VVGDPETVNNTYIEQIVMSAKAAIDKAADKAFRDLNPSIGRTRFVCEVDLSPIVAQMLHVWTRVLLVLGCRTTVTTS